MRTKTLVPLIVVLASFARSAEPLIRDGQSAYAILLPEPRVELVFPPGETLDYAADFLADHIERATGCRLPIVREGTADAGDGPFLALGPTQLARQALGDGKADAPESFRILTVGPGVVICGERDARGRDRGTLFGVYEFLERGFGIRWYHGDDKWYPPGQGTVIPKRTTVDLTALDVREAPAFRQREGGISYYFWPIERQRLWHPVLRFGNTRDHGTANHTQTGWTDLYGQTHPEYFAVGRNGRRQINFNHKHRSYICLTHPGVLTQMVANIEAFDRTGRSTGAFGPRDPEPHCVYFNPNDGMTPETICHCDGCRPFLRPDRPFEGQSSELVFQFVRRYAEAIAARWPGRRLAVLAYAHYKDPPSETTIPGNVDVTYVGPPVQYAMDPDIYRRHHDTLAAWSALLGRRPDRLSLWMNVHSPNAYTSFIPTLYPRTLARWLREHRDLVSGYFINGGNPHLKRRGPRAIWTGIQSFPMVWLQSRLLWNPDLDPDALLAQYCRDLYGPAADTMLALQTLIRNRWEEFYLGELDLDETAFIHRVRYPKPVIERFRALLDRAAEEARPDEAAFGRIVFLRDRVYSHFLGESRLYQDWGDRVAAYTCLATRTPPKIDGNLDDPGWRNIPSFRLAQRQWGEASDRETSIRLLHDGTNLYVGAALRAGPGTALTNEQLWVQAARVLDPVRQQYATNLDQRWEAFRELRIAADGTLACRDPHDASTAIAASIAGETLTIEARLAVSDLVLQGDAIDARQLRLQFLRTWGDWQRFDVWSPTLSHISDYPTYRFGLVQFGQGAALAVPSSLE